MKKNKIPEFFNDSLAQQLKKALDQKVPPEDNAPKPVVGENYVDEARHSFGALRNDSDEGTRN